MRHARSDYDRIQDPTGAIPEDEPVFLLRAKDLASVSAVLAWADAAEEVGASPDMVKRAREWTAEMTRWRLANGAKIPDMPPDA